MRMYQHPNNLWHHFKLSCSFLICHKVINYWLILFSRTQFNFFIFITSVYSYKVLKPSKVNEVFFTFNSYILSILLHVVTYWYVTSCSMWITSYYYIQILLILCKVISRSFQVYFFFSHFSAAHVQMTLGFLRAISNLNIAISLIHL